MRPEAWTENSLPEAQWLGERGGYYIVRCGAQKADFSLEEGVQRQRVRYKKGAVAGVVLHIYTCPHICTTLALR